MIFNKKKCLKIINIVIAATMLFTATNLSTFASQDAADNGVYVRQMGRGYCTLASAVDMMRSKMYIEGNSSWP